MEYVVKSFDFRNVEEEELGIYRQIGREAFAQLFPDGPQMYDAAFMASIESGLSNQDIIGYYVTPAGRPEKPVAHARTHYVLEHSPSYEGNEYDCMIAGPIVLEEHQGRGIARKMLSLVCDHAIKSGRTRLIGGILNERGREFARVLGGKEVQTVRINRLDLKGVDWSMVEDWAKEGASRSSEARLEFFTSIPDDILEEYCRVCTEVANQAPRDEREAGDWVTTPEDERQREKKHSDAGLTNLTAIIREENGDISGFTDVLYTPSRAPILQQMFTGVLKKYRGQRRGKWLKAAMLLKVRELFPDIEVIDTGNASSNAPMLHINEKLGFRLHRESHVCQAEVSEVKANLES